MVPVVIGATTHVVYPQLGASLKYGRGFSGVVTAFGGFLLGSSINAISANQPDRIGYFSLGVVLLLILGSVLVFLQTSPILFGALTLLTLVGIALGRRAGHIATVDEFIQWAQANQLLAGVVMVGVCVGIISLVASFPSDLTSGSGRVNVISHGTGLIVGLFTGLLANGFNRTD